MLIARGRPHTFANPFEEPARMLILSTPGGFEEYFFAVADLAQTGPVDHAAMAALSARYGAVPPD